MRWLCLALIALAACAPRATTDAAALRALLTPDRVAALRVPMIFVAVPELGVAATLVSLKQNGAVTTWRTRDDVQLSYRGGHVVATRGLGHDLMSADVGGVVRALRGGPAVYDRSVSYLDGDFGTRFETWRCALRPQGRVFDEECTGPMGPITNRFRVADDGVILWSRQWISAEIGYLETELIAR